MTSLNELSSTISVNVDQITKYLGTHRLPPPSFDPDSPSSLPADPLVQRARLALIEAASALTNLAIGSADFTRWQTKHDELVLHFLTHFKVFDAVPVHGSISYSDLAAKVGLVESRLRRILQHAFTNRYFFSPKSSFVAHTSNSAVVANNPNAQAWILHNVAEVEPWYSTKALESFIKWGDTTDPKKTGPNLAVKPGEEKTFFELMTLPEEGEWLGVKRKDWRFQRFQDSDKFMAEGGALKAADLHEGFDWGALGKATIVDIGGSVGNVSLEIGSRNPQLSFIVQDKAHWETQFNDNIPAHEKSRFSFQPHDAFAPQPVRGADVYFMRATLHKFPDANAIAIVKNITPAMEVNKSRLITQDVIMDGGDPTDQAVTKDMVGTDKKQLPGMGQTGTITRLNTSIDMQMMAVLNGRERTREEWVRLFKDADERFVLVECKQPLGNSASVLYWVLRE